MRLSFQQIYLSANNTKEFETLLHKWYFWATHSRIEPMKKVAKTIKRHWDGIVSFQESKINNGVLEGINSVIQATKSKARGYKTDRNFIAVIYLLTGSLDFSKINHTYVKV